MCRAVVWVILGLGLGYVKFNISIKHPKIKEAVGNMSLGCGREVWARDTNLGANNIYMVCKAVR